MTRPLVFSIIAPFFALAPMHAAAAPLTLAQVPGQARIHLGPDADWVAITPGAVWAASKRPNIVSRVDPATNRVDARVPLPGVPCAGLASGLGSLWVPVCGARPAIVRIDLARARIEAVFAVDAVLPESAIAVGADGVWVPLGGTGQLFKLDPDTGRVRVAVRVPPGTLDPIVVGGIVWATSASRGRVSVIDDASGRLRSTLRAGAGPRFLSAGAGAVWVLNQGDGTVDRFDAATLRRTATIAARSPGRGGDIAFGQGLVWTSVQGKPLTALDPARMAVVRQWTGPGGDSLRVGYGSVWLTDLKRGDLLRLPVAALLAKPISARSAAPRPAPRR